MKRRGAQTGPSTAARSATATKDNITTPPVHRLEPANRPTSKQLIPLQASRSKTSKSASPTETRYEAEPIGASGQTTASCCRLNRTSRTYTRSSELARTMPRVFPTSAASASRMRAGSLSVLHTSSARVGKIKPQSDVCYGARGRQSRGSSRGE